jgi:hypothetical protein
MSKYFILLGMIVFSLNVFGQKKIVVRFENMANGKRIVLNDSVYENAFGEKYTVSKLKYYVSNICLVTKGALEIDKTVYLIDAAKENTIIKKDSRKIVGISFLLGVDSALHSSGAQSGALDPLNDMFWTWNNGYVNFKLDGKSESSTADNKRIEQHIGGYKGEYKTMRKISFRIDQKYFFKNNTITIQMNLDEYWDRINEIKIAENPVIATAGVLAIKAADNFIGMFKLKNVERVK